MNNLHTTLHHRSKTLPLMVLLVLPVMQNANAKDDASDSHCYDMARSVMIVSISAIASGVVNTATIKQYIKHILPLSKDSTELLAVKLLTLADESDIGGLAVRLDLSAKNYVNCISQLANNRQDTSKAMAQYSRISNLSEMVGSLAKVADGFNRVQKNTDLPGCIWGLVNICGWLKGTEKKLASISETEDAEFNSLIKNERTALSQGVKQIPVAIMECTRVLTKCGNAEVQKLSDGIVANAECTQTASLLEQLSSDIASIRTSAGRILTLADKQELDTASQKFAIAQKVAEMLSQQKPKPRR